MTQRLIGAESNKRMGYAVFRISGKFCRKRWLYRRYDFLSRAWRHKVRIVNAWKSAVFSQKRLRSKELYRADCCVKRKPAWFKTEIGVFALRLIKKSETSQTFGALCVTVNTQNIERFLCTEKCWCRLALIDDKGLCICTFGRGGEGSIFRKTNSVDGIGAAFPLCGVFSYLHL